METPNRVVVVGGGIAGMETLFALRQRLGDRVSLTLIADRPEFVFRPNTIYVPFGGAEDAVRIPLSSPAERRDIDVQYGKVTWVETDPQRIVLDDGRTVDYDYLVLATGAAMRPEEIPGLAEHAHLVWTLEQMHELGRALRRVRDAAVDGSPQHVLFLVPPGNRYPGPVYELAFMLETWLRRSRVRDLVCLTFATCESTYLEDFGTGLRPVIAEEFTERGIIGYTHSEATGVEPHRVRFADGTARTFDLLVSAVPQAAAVDYEGLATDDRGFLRTDLETRRVKGTEAVYAPGDAGDFPVKQGFLSVLQADAVADDIAFRIDPDAVPSPRSFDPVGLYVMEMLDGAMFTQVPMTLTDDPDRPVRVRDETAEDYLVGVSPIWRLGKRTLGAYLPQQFRAGRPLHRGFPWGVLSLGLWGMSKALAGPAEE